MTLTNYGFILVLILSLFCLITYVKLDYYSRVHEHPGTLRSSCTTHEARTRAMNSPRN